MSEIQGDRRVEISTHSRSFLYLARLSIAARFGVTKGVTPSQSRGGLVSGLSCVFSTSAATPLSSGAILQEVAALHVNIGHSSPYSISTQIGILRKLLLGKTPDEVGWWKKDREGELPLVVDTDKADIIARLLVVKSGTSLPFLPRRRALTVELHLYHFRGRVRDWPELKARHFRRN